MGTKKPHGKSQQQQEECVENPENGSEESEQSSDKEDFYMQRTIAFRKPTSKLPQEDQKNGPITRKRKRVGAKKASMATASAASSSRLKGTRVFSEQDEIAILQGVIDYGKSENGLDRLSNMKGLYEYLKGKLNHEFAKTQVYEKIRRFKEKYFKNLGKKIKKKGEDPVFEEPHDAKLFKLSKKIWGGSIAQNGTDSDSDSDSDDDDDEDEVEDEEDNGDFLSKYPYLWESLKFMPESLVGFMKENTSVIGRENAKDLEIKWMEYRSMEIEVHLMKLNLKRELINLVLDAKEE